MLMHISVEYSEYRKRWMIDKLARWIHTLLEVREVFSFWFHAIEMINVK